MGENGRALGGALILVVAACSTGPTVYPVLWKTGSTSAQRLAEGNECEVRALRDAPRSIATGVSPSFTTPVSVTCANYGNVTNCQQYGGQTFGGQSYSTDLNADLRERIYQQCMAEKGYSSLVFPGCTDEQLAGRTVTPKSSGENPPPNEILCLTEVGFVRR